MVTLRRLKFPILTVLVVNFLACAEQTVQPENTLPACVYPNRQAAPSWVCGKPVLGVAIQAVGVADKSVAGLNYMQDMAKIAAVKHLSELFKVKVAKSISQYLTLIAAGNAVSIKVGESVTQTINSETLEVAKQYHAQTGPEGRMYVLVGLDKETSRMLLEKAVKISMTKDQDLWLKIQTQKSFAEMAVEIAAIEG